MGRDTYGAGGGHDGHHHGQSHQGEARRVAEPSDHLEAATEAVLLDDECAEDPPDHPGEAAGDREVTREAPTVVEQRRGHDEGHRPEGAEPVERHEQRLQPVRQGVEELEDALLGRRDVAGVLGEEDHHHDGDAEAHHVAGAAAVRLLGRRPEGVHAHAVEASPDALVLLRLERVVSPGHGVHPTRNPDGGQ